VEGRPLAEPPLLWETPPTFPMTPSVTSSSLAATLPSLRSRFSLSLSLVYADCCFSYLIHHLNPLVSEFLISTTALNPLLLQLLRHLLYVNFSSLAFKILTVCSPTRNQLRPSHNATPASASFSPFWNSPNSLTPALRTTRPHPTAI
jgi:hypothetical protein